MSTTNNRYIPNVPLTALRWAIKKGDVADIKELLYTEHANPNDTDGYGRNALHELCNSYRIKKFSTEDLGKIIYWLIDRHVDVSHKNHFDQTALDIAVELRDVTLAGLIAIGGVRPTN
jgi:ankyrin repeat protein